MIEFDSQNDFVLDNSALYAHWLADVANHERYVVKSLGYVFCTDEFLLKINQEHLNHETYTDIITFDYSMDDQLEGEIYISIDRVKENSLEYKVAFEDELRRVMVHGLLHMMGHQDKTHEERLNMRKLETEKMQMFHVKQ